MMKNWKLFFVVALFFGIGKVYAQEWKLGQDYNITFASKDASGVFKDFSGSIVFDSENLSSSSMKLKIKVESINTGNGLQNKHAKSEEWFDAGKHPNITFESTRIEKTENGFKAVGKLEIRGVKKDVTIPFTFVKKGSKGTFVAKFSVDRTDYGVGKKGNDVSETIKITATIPVTK
jgi:polyisoprenoid-binding protein YceI